MVKAYSATKLPLLYSTELHHPLHKDGLPSSGLREAGGVGASVDQLSGGTANAATRQVCMAHHDPLFMNIDLFCFGLGYASTHIILYK